MKIKLTTVKREVVETTEEMKREVILRKNCNKELVLTVVDGNGNRRYDLLKLQNDGRVRLFRNIPENDGWELNIRGQLHLDTTTCAKNQNR